MINEIRSRFFKKINTIDNTYRQTPKKDRLQKIKSEMKKKLQLTPQKYKRSWEITMNKYMPIKRIT